MAAAQTDDFETPAKAVQAEEAPKAPQAPKKAKAKAKAEPLADEDAAADTAKKTKAKRAVPKKRKAAAGEPPVMTAVEPEAKSDALAPLPEGATGFRKRTKKPDYKPQPSSSIPGMTVGEVRKVRLLQDVYNAFASFHKQRLTHLLLFLQCLNQVDTCPCTLSLY